MTDQPAPPPFDVNAALRAVLEATRDKVRASRTVDLWRDRINREALRRYAEERSAPAWNTPQLGKVRLDPKPASAHVTDADTFAAYVVDRFPSEVEATILLPAAQLEEALDALKFAGVDVHRSSAEVRPSFRDKLLDEALVGEARPESAPGAGDAEPAYVLRRLDDVGTVEAIPGTGVTPAGATLVVTIDPDLKRATLEKVDAELAVEETKAEPTITEQQHAHAAAVAERIKAQLAGAGLPVTTAAELPTSPSCSDADHIAAGLHNGSRCDAPPDEAQAAPAYVVTYTARPGRSDYVVSDNLHGPSTADDTVVLDAALLESAYKSDALRRACRRLTLSATGTKSDLAGRLHNAGVTAHRMKELLA